MDATMRPAGKSKIKITLKIQRIANTLGWKQSLQVFALYVISLCAGGLPFRRYPLYAGPFLRKEVG
jgi:hypothetical protein